MYIVPKRLAKKAEIFDGVGIKEIGVFTLFFSVGLVVFLILAPFGINILIRLGILGGLSFIGVGLIFPMQYKENFITLARRYFKYNNQQNRYFFYRGTGGFSPNNLKD